MVLTFAFPVGCRSRTGRHRKERFFEALWSLTFMYPLCFQSLSSFSASPSHVFPLFAFLKLRLPSTGHDPRTKCFVGDWFGDSGDEGEGSPASLFAVAWQVP